MIFVPQTLIFCSLSLTRVVPSTHYSCSLISCSLRRRFFFFGHNIFVPWVEKICSSDTILEKICSSYTIFVPCIYDICSTDANFLFLEFDESCSYDALFLFPDFLFPNKMIFFSEHNIFVPWVEKICSSDTMFVPCIDDICSMDANFLFLEFYESCSPDAVFLFHKKKIFFFEHNIFVPWVEKICSSDTIFVPCIDDICSTDANFLFLEFDDRGSSDTLFLFPKQMRCVLWIQDCCSFEALFLFPG
jgi:hypothetical protein